MNTKTKLLAALKIWLAIYPSLTLLLYMSGESLIALPIYQRTLLLTIVLVPWIIFAGLPLVNRIMGLVLSKINQN